MDYIGVWATLWVMTACACAAIAAVKERSVLFWSFIGFFTGLLGLIIIAVIPSAADRPDTHNTNNANDRDCPMCAERIKSAAIKCKHCGSDVTPVVNV